LASALVGAELGAAAADAPASPPPPAAAALDVVVVVVAVEVADDGDAALSGAAGFVVYLRIKASISFRLASRWAVAGLGRSSAGARDLVCAPLAGWELPCGTDLTGVELPGGELAASGVVTLGELTGEATGVVPATGSSMST